MKESFEKIDFIHTVKNLWRSCKNIRSWNIWKSMCL